MMRRRVPPFLPVSSLTQVLEIAGAREVWGGREEILAVGLHACGRMCGCFDINPPFLPEIIERFLSDE
jgi:hypothetical protein